MWANLQETADLATFTEEILNGKLHFLCSVSCWNYGHSQVEIKYQEKQSDHKKYYCDFHKI